MKAPDQAGSAGSALRVFLVAAVAAGVFLDVRHGAFLAWDDDINLTLNAHLDLTWENVRWMFTDADHMRRYVPLAWLGWSLERAWFGLTPFSAHVGNLLWHAANAGLLFLVLRRLFRSPGPDGPDRRSEWAAAAGAALWAVHPLRVEVVAWASGRLYAQAICLLLLATLAYLRAVAGPPERRRPWLLAAQVAYLASLLTYPLALAFPVALVVLDAWVLGRLGPAAGGWWGRAARRVWLEKGPFLLIALAVLAMSLLARLQAGGLWEPAPSLAEVGLGTRAMRAFYLWAYFAWKPLLPFDLAPVYTTLVWFDPGSMRFVLSAAGVVFVTVVLGWRRRVWPGAWALWLCHLVLLVPMLGLTERVHYPSDRYSYLPALLGAGAVAVGLRTLRPWLVPSLVGPALVACAVLTGAQIRIWRDSESLFRHLLRVVDDVRYRDDLAFRLAEVLRVAGRADEAAAAYRESLAAGPAGARAPEAQAALARWAAGRGAIAEARERYERALALRPGDAELHLEAARVLLGNGASADAVRILESGVAALPERGALRHDLAKALLQTGDFRRAVAEAEAAVRLLPRVAAAHRLLGAALQAAGRPEEAAVALATAARLETPATAAPEGPRAGR
jgi:Flp pilus assembly protein TadD